MKLGAQGSELNVLSYFELRLHIKFIVFQILIEKSSEPDKVPERVKPGHEQGM